MRRTWTAVAVLLAGFSGTIAADLSAQDIVFPAADWEEATPASQGVDPEKLAAAVNYLRKNSGPDGVQELVIIRHGRMIWKGDEIDNVHGVWSCTKSFSSTVLGLLIDDGKCSLNSRAHEFIPELERSYPDVTLRHFTTMTSGYQAFGDESRNGYTHGPSRTPFRPNPDPLFTPPGSHYAYWDSAMNQFGNVLTRVAGEPLEELFRRRIAEPIGMDPTKWNWGDFGEIDGIVVNGGAGNLGRHMQISAREMARLGHLYLNRGRWNGRQLISSGWIDATTKPQVLASIPLGAPDRSDTQGPGFYGFNWWTNGVGADGKRKWPGAPQETFAASGFNNNDMFVIPPWQMVVVRLGLDEGHVKITDEVYGTFLRMVGQAIDSGRR